MNDPSPEQLYDSMQAEYKEVAQNFRTLTDIRFKLLSFLPIGPVLISLSAPLSKGQISVPLSLFGLVVTLALIVYNERNNQLYDELVSRAAQLERLLGLRDGNFAHRPKSWLKIRPIPESRDGEFAVPIDHGWAIGTIYRASIVAWLFMLFSPIFRSLGAKVLSAADFNVRLAEPLSTVFALITAISVCQLFFNWFEKQKCNRQKSMRRQAVEVVNKLAALKFPPEPDQRDAWAAIFSLVVDLRGAESSKEFDKVLPCARFYLSKDLMQSTSNVYYPLPPSESSSEFGATTAGHIIALLTDLPARWLIDVHSGRRGSEEKSESEEERAKLRSKRIIEWLQEIRS